MPSEPRLKLLNTDLEGQEFFLTKDVTTIGRAPDNDIVLDQISVSRYHARIERFGNQYIASDLGSRNGIRINGKSTPEGPLTDGGTLAVGDVLFRPESVGVSGEERKPPPPPPPPLRRDRDPTPPPVSPPSGYALPTQPETRPPVSPPPSPQAEAPSQETAPPPPSPRKGPFRLGPTGVFVLVLVICLGALLGAYHLFGNPPEALTMTMLEVKIKVNEQRWLPVEGDVMVHGKPQSVSTDFVAESIEIQPPGIVDAWKLDEGELVVKGLAWGNALITMRSPRGNRIFLKVFVRGRMPTLEDEIAQAELSDEARRARAVQSMQAAAIHEAKGRPYEAIREYEAVVAYLKPLQNRGILYIEAREKARKMEEEVNKRYAELRRQAQQANERGNYARALDLTNLILELIPDPNDPRHQRAANLLQTWTLERESQKNKR